MIVDLEFLNDIKVKLHKYTLLPKNHKYDMAEAVLFTNNATNKDCHIVVEPGLFSKSRNMLIMTLLQLTLDDGLSTKSYDIPNMLAHIMEILSELDYEYIDKTYINLEHYLFRTYKGLYISKNDVLETIRATDISQSSNKDNGIDIHEWKDTVSLYKLSANKLSDHQRTELKETEDSQYLLFQLYDYSYNLFQLCGNFIHSLPKLMRKKDSYGAITNERFKLCCIARDFYFVLLQQNNSKCCEFEGYTINNDKYLLKAYKYLYYLCHKIYYDFHSSLQVNNTQSPDDIMFNQVLLKLSKQSTKLSTKVYDIYFPDLLKSGNSKIGEFDIFEARQRNYHKGNLQTKNINKSANVVRRNLTKQFVCFVNGLLLGYVPNTLPSVEEILKSFSSNKNFYLYGDIIPYDFSYAKDLSADDFCYILDIKPSQYRDRFINLRNGLSSTENISMTSIVNLSNAINQRWPQTILFRQTNSEAEAKLQQHLPLICYKDSLASFDYHFEIPQLFLTCFTEDLLKLLIQEKDYDQLASLLSKHTKESLLKTKKLNIDTSFTDTKLLTKQDVKITLLYLKYVVKKMYEGTVLFRKYGTDCICNDSIQNAKNRFIKFIQTQQNWTIIFPSYVLSKMLEKVCMTIKHNDEIEKCWGGNVDYSMIVCDKNKSFLKQIYSLP